MTDKITPVLGRYERKMFISEALYAEVEALIRSHPAMFREVFVQRSINNIYFDTYDLKNYWDNVSGSGNRVKPRIRWYGDQIGVTDNSTLELKSKDGLVGWKERYHIGALSSDSKLTSRALQSAIIKSEMPQCVKLSLSFLEPTLLNRYIRRYFISQNQRFRVTLDFQMEYLPIGPAGPARLERIKDSKNLVLEIKYGTEHVEQASDITQFFPFRITRSSKYVTGMGLVRSLQS